jgi:hypothetical protein
VIKILIKILIIIVSYFLVGYWREDVFVNINRMLFMKLNGTDAHYYYTETLYASLSTTSYRFLYALKWILNIFFSILYLSLAGLFNLWLFNKNIFKEIFLILAALITISGFLIFIGFIINNYSIPYKLARFLMGIAQSPLLFIISAPFVWSQMSFNKKES